jgi:hypothetical protein
LAWAEIRTAFTTALRPPGPGEGPHVAEGVCSVQSLLVSSLPLQLRQV